MPLQARASAYSGCRATCVPEFRAGFESAPPKRVIGMGPRGILSDRTTTSLYHSRILPASISHLCKKCLSRCREVDPDLGMRTRDMIVSRS